MGTVNPRFLRPAHLQLANVSSIDKIPELRGTFAIVGDKMYAYGDSGLLQFSTGTPIPRPTLVSAELAADGLTLSAAFSEEITSEDYGLGFTVLVDGEPAEIDAAVLGGDDESIDFTMAAPIFTGQDVVLKYVRGDIAMANGMTLHDVTVTATNGSLETNPVASTRILAADGVTLTVDFSENLVSPGDDAALGFTIAVDGEAVEILDAAITDDDIVFTVPPIITGAVVTIAYDADDGDIESADGLPLASFTAAAVTNNSALTLPTVESAVLGVDGETLTVTLSENVESPSEAPEAGFVVTVGGEAVEILDAVLTDDSLVLTIAPVTSEGVLLLSYTAGGEAGDIRAVATELALESFADSAVTNNSEVV